MTLTMLGFLYPVVLLALAVILIRGYIRTRNIGYLVLMLPLPLWPLITGGTRAFVGDRIFDTIPGGSTFPFLTRGEIWVVFLQGTRLLQALLMVVGFLLLSRSSDPPSFGSNLTGSGPIES